MRCNVNCVRVFSFGVTIVILERERVIVVSLDKNCVSMLLSSFRVRVRVRVSN